jgi:hypothetical protein
LDAIYPSTKVDSNKKRLSGVNNYTLHFAANQTPPVNGFWSITMYNPQQFFVPNPLNKYNVGPKYPLVYNADGSLDLYFQTTSPGADLEPNWLPAPNSSFSLTLRMYWPLVTVPQIVDETWLLPAVQKSP